MKIDFMIVKRNAKSAVLKVWGGVAAAFNATPPRIWPARQSLEVLLPADNFGDG